MFYALVAVAAFLIASYTDLKTREVPETLTIGLIAIGLSAHAIESILASNYSILISCVYMTLLAFAFSYFLYKIGAWAGGDVKLFTGLAAILPVYGQLDYFPFLVFAASFLAVFPFLLIYISYFLVTVKRLRDKIKPVLFRALKRTIPVAAASAVLLPMFDWAKFPTNFTYVVAVSFLYFFGINSFKIARDNILRKTVPVSKLEDGMIPAEDIYLGETKIANSKQAGGLTLDEIRKIRKIRKSIKIKISIPFVPIIALGLIILLFLEKLIK